eukprot:Skav206578  [mRNA]  locus=scaffold925:845288:845549:+ [translate_table: standard]
MFKKRHQREMSTRCLHDVVLIGGLPARMVRLRETNQSSFLQMHTIMTIMLPTRDAYATLPTQNAYASLRISFSPMRTAYAINF